MLRDGLRTWQALLAAVAGGLGLAAAFPPVGIWPLAVVGPALLAVALWQRSLRGSFLVGLVFGLAFFVPLLSWVVNVAWYAWAGLAGADTVLFAVLALGQRLLLRLRAWPLAVGVWWVAAEVAARPVAVRRLPVGAAGHEPGGRADRELGRRGRPVPADVPARADRGLPGLADPRLGRAGTGASRVPCAAGPFRWPA